MRPVTMEKKHPFQTTSRFNGCAFTPSANAMTQLTHHSTSWSRRDLHRMALATALAPWLSPGAQAQISPMRWQVNPFNLGVASGQPQPGSVVLWTRLAPVPDAPGGGMAPATIIERF